MVESGSVKDKSRGSGVWTGEDTTEESEYYSYVGFQSKTTVNNSYVVRGNCY